MNGHFTCPGTFRGPEFFPSAKATQGNLVYQMAPRHPPTDLLYL